MTGEAFGRTNVAVPPVWLGLLPGGDEPEALARTAEAAGVPLDISSQPGLWGGHLRGTSATLTTFGNFDIERATDSAHAADLIQSHLIETLCAIGRETIDFYFLPIRRAVEEFQISGALEALEAARQEGHVRFLGLYCAGPGLAVLGTWQFHDAFEVLVLPRNPVETEPYATLAPMAKERRVGVLTCHTLNWGSGVPFAALPGPWRLRNLALGKYGVNLAQAAVALATRQHPALVGVRTLAELEAALAAPAAELPEGVTAVIDEFAGAYADPKEYAALTDHPQPAIAAAARRFLERAQP